MTPPQDVGSIVSLWRYPVKSIVYAVVLQGGKIHRGDSVRLE
jgi:hypothetical protein